MTYIIYKYIIRIVKGNFFIFVNYVCVCIYTVYTHILYKQTVMLDVINRSVQERAYDLVQSHKDLARGQD